ncbi:MAG: hypothetical protein QOG45_2503 [Chloroflexota bacterium]|nr:hypothetical protein [Chloroflexota bacterium]
MRRLRHLLLVACLCAGGYAGLLAPPTALADSFPRPAAVREMVQGLRLLNWFPAQGPHDRMWTAFDPDAIDRDLGAVAALHGNAVRVIADVRVFTVPSPPSVYLDELSRTVGLAAAHGLRVQLTLFDQFGEYARVADSERWADAVLGRFRGDPRIAFIELQNQIAPQDDGAMRWARQLLPYVREVSGGIPVTVSVDAPASNLVDLQLALGSAAPDFWDFHYYFLPGSGQATFREVAAVAAPRPLLIGEAGYSTFPGNDAIPGVPPSAPAQEAYQDYLLRTVELAAIEAGLPPAAPWLLNDFRSCGDCKPVDDFYGLFRADGSAKPAAATISRTFAGVPVDRDIDLGFEGAAGDDPAYWRVLGAAGATFRRDPVIAHGGTASALIEGGEQGAAGDHCWAVQPLDPPRTGGRYSLSAWARGRSATGRTAVEVAWLDYRGGAIDTAASSPLTEGDTGWTRLSVSSSVPAGTVAAELRLCTAENSGSAWFDDVRFDPAGT